MPQSTTDDSFNAPLQTWDDVDRWLLGRRAGIPIAGGIAGDRCG